MKHFIGPLLTVSLGFIPTVIHATELEEVIVSATTLDNVHSDNARAVSVLNGDKLRTHAASTLAETLAGQAGVSNSSFGSNVGNPVIRGQNAARVKVMQDNLDSLDASTVSADHANTTEPLLADQIEILRGPATLRFGNGAIGGVVNVIDGRIPTRLTSSPIKGAIETRHSSVNDETASVVRLDGSFNQFAWHADGVYRESNETDIPGSANRTEPSESSRGYVENTQARADAASLGGSWITDNGFIGLSVNHQNNLYGIPPGAHEHHDDGGHDDHEELVRIDMQQTRYDLKAEQQNLPYGFEKIRIRYAYNDYQHRELEGKEVGTTFANKAQEGRVELLHDTIGNWHGMIGLQWLDRDFSAIGAEAFVPSADITSEGIFLIEETHWGQNDAHFLQWGLRAEQQSINPKGEKSVDHTTASASIDYRLQMNEHHFFSTVFSLAERAPTLEELFSDGPHLATQSYEIGNSNLDPELSKNIEFGYTWQNLASIGLAEAKVNIFLNQVDQFIYAYNTGIEDPDEELPIYQYQQADAEFYGFEAETYFRLNETFGLRFFGDYVRAKLDKGGDLPRITPPRLGAELTYENNVITAALKVTHANDQNHPGDNEADTDSYTQVDASLHWLLVDSEQPLTLFVRANNLFNEEIRYATSFLRDVAPAAGRNITTGVRWEF